MGHGVIKKPVSTGLRRSTLAQKNGSATKARPCAENAAQEVIADSANSGRRSRSTGNMGAGWPASRRNRAAVQASTVAAPNSNSGQGSPCAAPARVPISAAKPSMVSAAVSRSTAWPRRAARGSAGQATASAIAPSGTLMANSQGQLPMASTSDASVGPTANATPTTSALSPTPRPSWLAGKMARISARFTLISAPAPIPCSARAPASNNRLGASAQPSEASVKNARPPRNTRRGPSTSPSAANGSKVATTANW